MRNIAFIPARGGSKGLPGKNTKKICGKPLIVWSIGQALSSDSIDEVFVSTDSPDIAAIAEEHGAKVPFLRPASISDDTATTESAMIHFCDWCISQGIEFENFLLLQVTSPVREQDTLDRALRYFNEGDFDSLVAVAPMHRFFWSNPGSPHASYDFMNRPRRQDIRSEDLTYVETGSFYITKFDALISSKNRLCGKIGMFVTREEESYEIDSQTDFDFVEGIMKKVLGIK